MKTVAILQARMASTRLPGKILADLAGKPLLEHVVLRAQLAQTLNSVIVATTHSPADDEVAHFCQKVGIPYFRGSENDVLDRYFQAAKCFEADIVVRLTADCPLLDPTVIDKVVNVFRSSDNDYVSNTIKPTYPDGLDIEVFWRDVLERVWREANLTSEREHVTPYIWKHPDLFRLLNVEQPEDLSTLRWTVDEPQDLEFVRRIYALSDQESHFGMMEILALLREHPELTTINAEFERNEGYQKSLHEDSITSKKDMK